MLDRMARTALLRRAMDEAGVTAPLHIFGALDPLSVCLYFLSGAEMFDGLTWIRYGYEDGRCLYTHNLGPLKYGLDATDNAIKSRTLFGNYYFRFLTQMCARFSPSRSAAPWEEGADALVPANQR